MIGLLTIGLIGIALCKKRGVAGIGALSKVEWYAYSDLISKIEQELINYIDANYDLDDYDDYAPFDNPRLDVSISPGSRTGYDFDVIIDELKHFKYPNKTYDIESLITVDEDGLHTIDYEELEYVVNDVLDRLTGNVAGIGAPYKRRIYREIERVQRDVDFDEVFENQTERAIEVITRECDLVNSKYPNRKPITPKRYYNQLRKAYNAISGIGVTNLPYKTYDVYNQRGDLILTHRDYGTKEDMFRDATVYLEESRIGRSFELGFWKTVIAIASGIKFVWDSNGAHRGVQQLLFGNKSPLEKKARSSYLSTPSKGGVYPEVFAEKELMNMDGDLYYNGFIDEQDFTNGVLEALLTITSKKQAKDLVLESYIQEHTLPDSEFSNTPF